MPLLFEAEPTPFTCRIVRCSSVLEPLFVGYNFQGAERGVPPELFFNILIDRKSHHREISIFLTFRGSVEAAKLLQVIKSPPPPGAYRVDIIWSL